MTVNTTISIFLQAAVDWLLEHSHGHRQFWLTFSLKQASRQVLESAVASDG